MGAASDVDPCLDDLQHGRKSLVSRSGRSNPGVMTGTRPSADEGKCTSRREGRWETGGIRPLFGVPAVSCVMESAGLDGGESVCLSCARGACHAMRRACRTICLVLERSFAAYPLYGSIASLRSLRSRFDSGPFGYSMDDGWLSIGRRSRRSGLGRRRRRSRKPCYHKISSNRSPELLSLGRQTAGCCYSEEL